MRDRITKEDLYHRFEGLKKHLFGNDGIYGQETPTKEMERFYGYALELKYSHELRKWRIQLRHVESGRAEYFFGTEMHSARELFEMMRCARLCLNLYCDIEMFRGIKKIGDAIEKDKKGKETR